MTDKRKQLAAFTRALPPTSRLRALQSTRIAGSKEGREFFVKMDITSNSRVESVVLMGLDFSMRPEKVRYEVSNGFITPFQEGRVIHQIKKFALMVYNQEKLTPLYHANVCENSNTLAYFLCAVHRQAAPQPQKKHTRHISVSSDTSVASEVSSNSQTSCTSAGKNCELPQLCTDSALSLGYWDGLYYALVAEIRRIHGDLQEKFGWAIEAGVQPLHYSGLDGATKEPVTPIEFASMLETAWFTLMDSRLVATLDDAVRMRKLRESAGKKHNSTSTKASSDSDSDGDDDTNPGAGLPMIDGLVDVNGMSTEDIIEMLWEKHAPEVDQACNEDFEDASMFTAYRAQLHAQTMEDARALHPGSVTSSSCHCRGKCICSLRCNIHASHCTCGPLVQTYHKIPSSETTETDVPHQFVKQDMRQKNHFVGDTTRLLMEMEINPSHTSALRAAQMPHNSAMGCPPQDRKMPSHYKNRERTNTGNSELAYVPEAKSSRGKGKDAYPLDFYDNGSPGRYPKIRKESSTASNDGGPVIAFINANRVPARKPVPAPLLPPQPYVAPDAGYGVVTPPSDNRYHQSAFVAARAQAAYHENARLQQAMLQSHDTVTQSFPTTSANPRRAAISDPFVDGTGPNDPADDYVGLLARHPSSFEQVEDKTEAFPTLTRSATTTPPRATKKENSSVSTTHLPSMKSLTGDTSKPMPPLPPLPDFIAPRPATVQRYVSAGGSLPLAQRAPIQGPAFNSTGGNTPVNNASGAGILKAELDAKMSDPEWVEKHFGAAAAERISLSPPRKLRESSESAIVADSQRNSREAYSRASVEPRNPRDRTSSGVSARLKRVFSRKNSEHESFD